MKMWCLFLIRFYESLLTKHEPEYTGNRNIIELLCHCQREQVDSVKHKNKELYGSHDD